MSTNTLDYQQSFNSFSGVDMNIIMGGHIIGEAMGVSWTTNREKVPIYTMGSANPRSFSRGKRGIAGTIVAVMMDRSALLDVLSNKTDGRFDYVANEYEVRQAYKRSTKLNQNADIASLSGSVGSQHGPSKANELRASKVMAKAQYLDQLMPVGLTLTGCNEYGSKCSMSIIGMEFLSNGCAISVDNIMTDESASFVCTDIIPWSDQGFIRGDNVLNTTTRDKIPPVGGGAGY